MKAILDLIVVTVVAVTIWYVYAEYGDRIITAIFGDQQHTIYVGDLAIGVTIADENHERVQGLSGVESLKELEGKLFIFETPGDYPIWMKDMVMPIDIIWISPDFKIVHIEENVTPDTYPARFHSAEPAQFVLETNAFFARTFKIGIGDMVTIPAASLPEDVRQRLLEDVGLQ